jgi:hypothetical protein
VPCRLGASQAAAGPRPGPRGRRAGAAHPGRPGLPDRDRVPLRAGTDIAFLGRIVNYVLANEKYFREYVLHLHQRPAPAAPAVRVPDPQAPLRPVHPQNWWSRSAAFRRPPSAECASWSRRTRAGTAPRPSPTAWAGPGTRSACQRDLEQVDPGLAGREHQGGLQAQHHRGQHHQARDLSAGELTHSHDQPAVASPVSIPASRPATALPAR